MPSPQFHSPDSVEQAIAEKMINRKGFRHVGVVKHFDIFQREVQP